MYSRRAPGPGGEVDPLVVIQKELESRHRQTSQFLSNLRQLETDIDQVEEGYTLHFCIDYYDLYSYLILEPKDLERKAPDGARVSDEYVRVLLFSRLENPVVLLPPYYLEFRDHVGRSFRSKSESESQKEKWSYALIQKFQQAAVAADSLFGYLDVRFLSSVALC